MTAPSAWRPLSEAPKNLPAYVETDHGCHVAQWDGEWVYYPDENLRRLSEDALSLPIADTLGLDRAVQSEIARAFGQLIEALVMVRTLRDVGNDGWADVHQSEAIQALKKLRVPFGGRIPDEVP
jgi:hypothetical protein